MSEGNRKQRRGGRRPTIVFVASEVIPFAKTGGLGDVVGSFAGELGNLGYRPIVILPKYKFIPDNLLRPTSHSINIPLGRTTVTAHIWESEIGSEVEVYLLDIPSFFDRASLYGEKGLDYPDNLARFAALSRGALELLKKLKIRPHILHVHDWQTSLIPLYLKSLYRRDPFFERSRSVLTIHNLSYQGRFDPSDMTFTGLRKNFLSPRYIEYYGEIRLLKGGIVSADWITTVSPTYEKEIQTEAFGCGMDSVIRTRAGFLTGILNGIDVKQWNPATDRHIRTRYTPENLRGKSSCKRALLKEMGLPARMDLPLIVMLSRLVEQKGISQAITAMPYLLESGTMWVVLGEGDPAYELKIAGLATSHPERIAIRIGYDDPLAHRILAGGDFILMPSIFEPCGLSQLYAMRYGTIPVVRGVGGLADSVTDYTLNPGKGTGFVFNNATLQALMSAVHRALSVYRHGPLWPELRRRAMAQDFSWSRSAEKYMAIYEKILSRPRAPIPRTSPS